MPDNSILFLWPLAAYLLGSISCAVIVSKLFKLSDPRKTGSGNPGATNVLRSGSKVAAALTLLGDLLKGLVPVSLAMHYGLSNGWVALIAMAAFFGHLFPIFFKFNGGKGVATAIGVFIALDWRLFAVFAACWLVIAIVSRYSSLAALLASGTTAIASFVVFQQTQQHQLIGAVFVIVAFLFQRHRVNIERLKNGKESKIGE
jgi:glycerol-3-phosphate acyltransferase PlsY